MAGRPHGKLLPRYAGPIAEFILTQPDATRYDLLDLIERTWGVRVSTVALHHFCKKFGLDRATRAEATAPRPRTGQTPAEPRGVETVPPERGRGQSSFRLLSPGALRRRGKGTGRTRSDPFRNHLQMSMPAFNHQNSSSKVNNRS
jgi:hypothetical protein